MLEDAWMVKIVKPLKTSTVFSGKDSYGDNIVTINVGLNRKTLLKLNKRQLWIFAKWAAFKSR